MTTLPSILRFDRLLVERIWGGDGLSAWLGLEAGTTRIGETWEIYDRGTEGSSRLLEPVAGCMDLRQLMENHSEALLGSAQANAQGRFPLMLKFLDARDRLSLQVHPDDELARELGTGDSGKDEAWVVLSAAPQAWLMRGLAPGHGIEDLYQALRVARELEPLVQRLPSQVGDVVEIAAGTLHCIGPGNRLYEIQKNSDLTWRLSDWGRLGTDGLPRELHLALGRRALESRALEPAGPIGGGKAAPQASHGAGVLVDCSAFFLERLLPRDSERRETRHLPQILTAVRGSALIRCGEEQSCLKEGETCLIRGGIDGYWLSPETMSTETGDPEGAVCELLLASPRHRQGR